MQRVAVLTCAGTSAASGVPTFRGAGGLWRTYSAMVSVRDDQEGIDTNGLL